MPYSVKGNCVIRSDTGAVVKKHPNREKAMAHLKALKANVESQEALYAQLDEHAAELAADRGPARGVREDRRVLGHPP